MRRRLDWWGLLALAVAVAIVVAIRAGTPDYLPDETLHRPGRDGWAVSPIGEARVVGVTQAESVLGMNEEFVEVRSSGDLVVVTLQFVATARTTSWSRAQLRARNGTRYTQVVADGLENMSSSSPGWLQQRAILFEVRPGDAEGAAVVFGPLQMSGVQAAVPNFELPLPPAERVSVVAIEAVPESVR